MPDIDMVEATRIVNMLLSFGALLLLAIVARFRHSKISDRLRTMLWVLIMWTALSFISTLENYVQSNPPGSRTYLTTVVLVVTMIGSYRYLQNEDNDA